MNIPSTSQRPNEEFTATIKFPDGDFEFKANKINIQKSVDISESECWTIMAFQEILKDTAAKIDRDNLKEVIAIHLHIPRETLNDDQMLVTGLPPPPETKPPTPLTLNKNSGNLFKIVDKEADPRHLIDTIENYLGIFGQITYSWDAEQTRITGTFLLFVSGSNQKIIPIKGNFNLLNRALHPI
jgi:hypothetical protein